MKLFTPAILLLAALTFTSASAQSSASANTAAASPRPQLTLSADPANTTTPTSAPVLNATPTPASQPLTREVKVPADPAAAFTAGIAAYNKNDYALARDLLAGAEKKAVSPALEFNLGNACYQSTDYGAAILHYLRALSFNPRDPDARQNLALARKGANVTAPEETRLDAYAAFFTQNSWTWITAVAGWAALYLAFFPRMFRWQGFLPWFLCAMMLIVAVAGGVGLWGAQKHAQDGVVLHADTPVNLSPTANSQSVAMLQPGEIARTIEQHGSYYKIKTNLGLVGWVDAANYSPVRP